MGGSVKAVFRANFVDFRLTGPKSWRDVYAYHPDGKLAGWTRYGIGEPQQFNADGLLVVEQDDRGRPTKTRTVKYTRAQPTNPRNLHLPVSQELGDEFVYYEYADENDLTGKEARREKVEAPAEEKK